MGNSPLVPPTGNRVQYLEPEREGESPILRSGFCGDELISNYDSNILTLHDLFRHSVQEYKNSPCLGFRENDGPFKWMPYGQVWKLAKNIGCGLLQIGVVPHETNIGIYSQNRPEWIIAEQACNAYSLPVVPLYDTLGPEAVSYIINQAEVPIVFCSGSVTGNVLQSAEEGESCIRYIVQFGELTFENKEHAEKLGIQLITFDNLAKQGELNQVECVPPQPDEISTICYTSGTTGDPKGVLLTHTNFIADIAGAYYNGIKPTNSDIHISYLPLAHVFERLVLTAVIANGGRVGFFRGDVKLHLFDDIALLRPTIFPSVPRLFNRLHDKVLQAVGEGSGIKQKIFHEAYERKKNGLKEGYLQDTFADLVFKQIAKKLGGRVRLMITGSAPIAPEILNFLRICFSCPVIEGYGQTETCAAATTTLACDLIPGHVGIPLVCTDIKLVEVEEMEEYSVTNDPPSGEICFRGPCISQGYYKMPEKTAETIDEYGWLHSGDIGVFLPDGNVKIVDRRKNIFKLSQGEYIAPEKLENIYKQSQYVLDIFVYGDSLKSRLIAIVSPDPDVVIPWAKSQGIEASSLSDFVDNEQLKDLIMEDLAVVGTHADVTGLERISDIFITDTEWTVNNLLTPTQKKKRPHFKNLYLQQIEDLYQNID
eukprot:TRINITY_DN10727_c0_g1_i1.p1 TRINITY_DN10727_c0_g1~~TRINITY_DN10727_c0_g1_i1.p1  ORF type:complete len:652 (-),score=177.93 TRINITY_DN10727_c0_g1_i1:24-1979(-)